MISSTFTIQNYAQKMSKYGFEHKFHNLNFFRHKFKKIARNEPKKTTLGLRECTIH